MAALAICPRLPREGSQFLLSLFFSIHLMFNCPYGSRLLAPLSWRVGPASPFTKGVLLAPSARPPSLSQPWWAPSQSGFWSPGPLLLPTGLYLKPPTPLCVPGAAALSLPSRAQQEHMCWCPLPCFLPFCTVYPAAAQTRPRCSSRWPLCAFSRSPLSCFCFLLSLVHCHTSCREVPPFPFPHEAPWVSGPLRPCAWPTASSSLTRHPFAFVERPLCAGEGRRSPAEMLGGGLPLQCSSLYEERYVLPSQTLNSQGSAPVQETHPLLGEWKVSTPCRCMT